MEPSSLAAKFSEDLAEITWSDIKPHAQRDAVIVVDGALDMVEVGVAIANDQVDKVQHWIAEALVQKPTSDQLSLICTNIRNPLYVHGIARPRIRTSC